MDEYLEKVLEAAFKREFEQDENIVRSLPFFAAALGLVVAIFAQIITRMPPHDTVPGKLVTGFLIMAGTTFLFVLWSLVQLVRAREFKVPPDEEKMLAWSDELVAFHRGQKKTQEKAEALAVSDVRRRMIEAYAEAAVSNRQANALKFRARSIGFMSIIYLITLATLAAGVIFISKQVERANDREPHHIQARDGSPKQADDRAQVGDGQVRIREEAGRPNAAHGGARPQVSLSAGSKELSNVGRNESAAASPAASAANPTAHGDRQKEH